MNTEIREITIMYYDLGSNQFEALYLDEQEIGIIKRELDNNKEIVLNSGNQYHKKISKEKANFYIYEVFRFVKFRINSNKDDRKDYINYLSVKLKRDNSIKVYNYVFESLNIMIKELSNLFSKEFNELFNLNFLKYIAEPIYKA